MVPLTNLLKKNQPWRWTEEQNVAFEKLKITISSEPILKLTNFDAPFEVHMNASAKAVDRVLMQEGNPSHSRVES